MSKRALERFAAFVDDYDDADRRRLWVRGRMQDVSKDDLRAVLAEAERAAELKRRIANAVAHLDRAINAEQRPAAVLQGDAQLARLALTGASSLIAPRNEPTRAKRKRSRR